MHDKSLCEIKYAMNIGTSCQLSAKVDVLTLDALNGLEQRLSPPLVILYAIAFNVLQH